MTVPHDSGRWYGVFGPEDFISERCRKKILGYIHRGHFGEVKCVQRAKKVLW